MDRELRGDERFGGRRARTFAVVAACALFAFQALPFFASRWVADENWYSIPAYTLLQQGALRNPTFPTTDYESKVDTHPVGTALSVTLGFRLLGTGVAQARIPSLIAATGTLVVTYFLALELAGPTVAVLAVLLAATDNFLLLAARSTRPEAYTAFFASLAVLLYVLARKKHSFWLALMSGLALGLALNFHVTVMGFLLSVAIFLAAEFGFAVWRKKRSWALLLGLLIGLLPFATWVASSATRRAAFKQMYVARAESQSVLQKIAGEKVRYSDLLGIGSQRVPLPVPVPLRAHIVLVLVLAMAVLYRRQRTLCMTLLILSLPTLLWWVYLVNKSSRYFAILAPYAAIAIAAAVVALRDTRWARAAVAAAVLVGVSQAAGNVWFVRSARTADYTQVANQLQKLIPRDESVYGAITFWEALHDRTYYAYDRTPFGYATGTEKPNYVIVGDRVMMQGSGFGTDDFQRLRRQLRTFVKDNGVLVGTVPSSFYGDLQVYRVDYRNIAARQDLNDVSDINP